MDDSFITLYSSQPALCEYFYTRIIGLELASDAEPTKACGGASGDGLAPGEPVVSSPGVASGTTASMDGYAAFRIDHATIRRLPRGKTTQRPARSRRPQDLYLLARHSLDVIRERMHAQAWTAQQGPICHEGRLNAMRILYLLDPDGNRIRLVEIRSGR